MDTEEERSEFQQRRLRFKKIKEAAGCTRLSCARTRLFGACFCQNAVDDEGFEDLTPAEMKAAFVRELLEDLNDD